MQKAIRIGMVDDNVALRNGIGNLLAGIGYQIIFGADNGRHLMGIIDNENLPDIILMDVNMPEMDGFEATAWMSRNFPQVPVVALSMSDSETSITRMFKNGAKGYILKDATAQEFHTAFQHVLEGRLYYHDKTLGRSLDSGPDEHVDPVTLLDEKEMQFLKMICSDLTWKEIARSLHSHAYTVDDTRDALFEKVKVTSRIGLVIFALKHRLIQSPS